MSILCVGEMMADIVVTSAPVIDFSVDSTLVDDIALKNGGDALNVSIGLAKLGASVAFIGKAGNDMFGTYIVDAAKRAGVDVSHVKVSKKLPNSRIIALVRKDGERCFLQCPGSNMEFSTEDIDYKLLADYTHLHIGGTFHLPAFDGEGAASLLAAARAAGLTTSMDVAYDHSGRWLSLIRPCLPHLTWFIPSEGEAECITGSAEPKEVCAFLQKEGVENVIIKRGKAGSYCRQGTKEFSCGSYDVPVVDATGAGDGFVAGFLNGLQAAMPVEDCVRMGTATAAFVLQAYGATDGVPSATALKDFMDKNVQLEIVYE